jgi:hypothetical protein
LIQTGTGDDQTVVLADQIRAVAREGCSYRDQAVLCTGNDRLATLAQDLERLGVPVLFLGSLFERTEVKDLLAFVSLLTDRRAMSIVRMACWSEFRMDLSDVDRILRRLRSKDDGSWLDRAGDTDGISDQARAALVALNAALRGFTETSSPWHVIATFLLDRSRMASRLATATGAAASTRAIAVWQLLNFLRAQPAGPGLPIVRLLERIRRLLRLSDERDLRQLPAAAQGIDAVRLMTIHGAKGLEFPVVHVTGMNKNTLPRSVGPIPCPPPEGMVEGGPGDPEALLKAAHAEEQECLFYVAMSRAENLLHFYAPTVNSAGSRRPLSPFIDRLGNTLSRTDVTPSVALPASPESQRIDIAFEGRPKFTNHQVRLYGACARRFFYTHILEVGGRRTITPFMRMHDVVRVVFQGLVAGAVLTDDQAVRERVQQEMDDAGLSHEGYAEHYRDLALQLLRFFVASRDGQTPEAPSELTISFGPDVIVVRPDDVLVRADGRRTLRHVQTGHMRSDEGRDAGAAAFVLAAQRAFPEAHVEMVHLADQTVLPYDLSPKELSTRRQKIQGHLDGIRAGRFPTDPSSRRCPGCPALFICGAAPDGPLRKLD